MNLVWKCFCDIQVKIFIRHGERIWSSGAKAGQEIRLKEISIEVKTMESSVSLPSSFKFSYIQFLLKSFLVFYFIMTLYIFLAD